MNIETMQTTIVNALEDVKVRDLVAIDVTDKTSVTDIMMVGSGTSNRHLQALVESVDEAMSAQGVEPLGREGDAGSDWVLIDYGDIIVHVMLPETRQHYDLEQLWSGASPGRAEAANDSH